ncbi:hypothetical protein D9613_006498 [Agrocybe pediades]|uniref:Uncharacterized protein n=1 Tax=Agrocybe pediades TaxID=84607 RepID=A0A8H4VKD0_9AGAR|nr:hypothetical protein D9613_006498 [Agrocybe pediades]
MVQFRVYNLLVAVLFVLPALAAPLPEAGNIQRRQLADNELDARGPKFSLDPLLKGLDDALKNLGKKIVATSKRDHEENIVSRSPDPNSIEDAIFKNFDTAIENAIHKFNH